jgi:hypothetical protein
MLLSAPLDAVENPPKEAPCQVALGRLEHEVPSMPDEAPAGLEPPLMWDYSRKDGWKAVAYHPPALAAAFDDPARDAATTVAGRIGPHVIGALMYDKGGPPAI